MLDELARKVGEDEIDILFVCDGGFRTQSEGIMRGVSVPVRIETIPSGKLRRYAHFSWWQYIRHFSIVLQNGVDTFKTAAGFFKSLWLIMMFRPDVVFAKGGFVCLPVGLAAWMCRTPLVIHDSDALPGLTNRLLARFAAAIGTGMPLENYNYNTDITKQVGVPINPKIVPVSATLRNEYRRAFDLPIDKKIVVAVGGGLGSAAINHAVIDVATVSHDSDVLFYNVTGVGNFDDAKVRSEGLINYEPVPFIYSNMHKLLGAADLVITRASATTLQELAGLRQAVIAVPAKQLGDQRKNADLFASYDAVVTVHDNDLERDLKATIETLLRDKKRRVQLARNLSTFARPHAASDMADMIVSSV